LTKPVFLSLSPQAQRQEQSGLVDAHPGLPDKIRLGRLLYIKQQLIDCCRLLSACRFLTRHGASARCFRRSAPRRNLSPPFILLHSSPLLYPIKRDLTNR